MNTENTTRLLQHIESLKRLLSDSPLEQSTLGTINRKLTAFSSDAGQSRLPVLQDVTLLLEENIRDMLDDNLTLSQPQHALFSDWLNKATTYVRNPINVLAARALIENLQNNAWNNALSSEDATIMIEMLGVMSTQDDSVTETAQSELPQETVETNYQSLLMSLEGILSRLPQDSEEVLNQAAITIEQIANNTGPMAFQDVCLLLQETLLDVVADKQELSPQQIELLCQWPDLAASFLNHSDDPERGHELVNLLERPDWINPISAEGAEVLRDMFGIVKADAAEAVNEDINIDVSAKPVPVSIELVGMLLDEMKLVGSDTSASLLKTATEETEIAVRNDALSQYLSRVERFGNACQAAELAGLYQASMVLQNNISKLIKNDSVISDEQLELLIAWPGLVQDYLANIGTKITSQAIVDYLASAVWPNPLMQEISWALVNLLNAPYLVETESSEERQAAATVEDISLQIPDDISAELLEGLLQELPLQTENFSAAIQSLINGKGDIKAVEKAQRIAHTVKGAANTVGIKGIANLTHQLEDIFALLKKHGRLPSQSLSMAMMNAADCLEEMSEALVEREPAPDNAREVLQRILDWINRLEKEGIEILDNEAPEAQEGATAATGSPVETETEAEDDKAVPMLRVPAPIIDDLIRILGETIILTTQLQENVRRTSQESDLLTNNNKLLQGIISELDQQVEMRGLVYNQQVAVNQSTVFDPLELEQYNELHTLTNQLTETVVDSFEMNRSIEYGLNDLDELLFQQSRLHRQVQEQVIKTRMVPIKTITARLQRSVRQTCRTTNKQASLYLKGADTLIDSDLLTGLTDPLMHMLRNAIDHGIESREERIRKQKPPEGRIDLGFYRDGTQIVVRCQDDGTGLNHDAIRQTAYERGLIDPEEYTDDKEINRLIFLPGFSTRRETTQVSGRGIGMDIVNSQIQAIKGSIHIESKPDKGCLFELRLPITLISSHSVLIRHRDQILAASNHGVVQILHPSDSEIMETEEQLMCRVGEEILDAVNLEDLIDMPGDRRAKPRETRPALLVEDGDERKVVFMQEITDVRELVIKNMGSYLKHIKGISGATILGDGSVVPVLDIPELIRTQGTYQHTLTLNYTQSGLRQSLPMALVVDDSLSARRSLAQVIKDAGYDVRTAKDGIEALEMTKKKRPDILLVDLEMPRMNGMELSSHIRAEASTANIPIIMVTSRSTEKHRKEAKRAGVNIYMTKPFNEDEMLDHINTLLN